MFCYDDTGHGPLFPPSWIFIVIYCAISGKTHSNDVRDPSLSFDVVYFGVLCLTEAWIESCFLLSSLLFSFLLILLHLLFLLLYSFFIDEHKV